MCDVYVYEDVSGGWTTHVAGGRRIIPPIPNIPIQWVPNFGGKYNQSSRSIEYDNRINKFLARVFFGAWAIWNSRIHLASLRLIPIRPIGLPYDEQSFNDDTAGECADRLEQLRAIGYIVLQYAIDALREEQAEEMP